MTNRGSSSASPPDSSTRHQKKKHRKLGLLAAMPKLNRRRFYLALKVMLLFVVFGLYFVLLLRESMSAFSAGGRGKSSGKVEQTSNPKPFQQHKPPAEGRLSRPIKAAGFQRPRQNSIHNHGGDDTLQSSKNHPQHDGITPNHSTLNPVYEYSEEMNAAAEADFTERRAMLWNVCADHRIIGKFAPNAWEFFISPGHGLAWCNIFKAASSTWMYYFNILGGYDVRYLQRTRASPIELARKRFPRPSTTELNDYLSNTISFLIVREPFERLVSAYRNKLEGCRNKYYKLLGEQIIKKFRKKIKDGEGRLITKYPKGPTFREFLQFLVAHYKSGGRFDEHWSPVYSFCTPCSINFTLIAKVETFQRDSEYIIRQAGLETLLLNKLPRGKARAIANRATSNTRNLVPRYFAQIDEQLLTEVLEIYQLDFELFGYNSTKYYSYVQETLDGAGR
ncbi:chondroitin 4-sulfotransferase [Culex quinquefasciatus]|uniref:Carbohydrate sulfotransferase n=1 Tax=Culex quinquefasciatus TaxID=7176 RepID=B0W1J7_CULQU|nr:chondroitin 4-sulfotransferase [Culex quinquefasciatus]|eukprot:XP_001842581.1 chondroitin 4-sulfotransferase [Culex quinquefasciatus]